MAESFKTIDIVEDDDLLIRIIISLKTGDVSFRPFEGCFKINSGKVQFGNKTDTEVKTTLLIN